MKTPDEHEDLLLRSRLYILNTAQQTALTTALETDRDLKRKATQYDTLMATLKRPAPDTFGPFFAERVVHVLKSMQAQIDQEIFSFFKKYQLIIAGVVVALLVVNTLLASDTSILAILGIGNNSEEPMVAADVFGQFFK